MWLLSTDRAELHYFANNFEATGGYAILSHTWDGKEQTLQEVQAIAECRREGTNPRDFVHPKVRNCCIIAEKYGYRWVWIDSCCIDKTSSSELSEAINSMFRWYKEAEVCFAYLADVPDLRAWKSAFRESRWHTRGWTLQELIAPDFLIFLSVDWRELGNRADLAELLEEITRVPFWVLTGKDLPAHYSICTRMFWASSRHTTRVEDEAYCLMGLFGVSMPTNYGEGKKAFIRLQYEIMQRNPDMSLFAFGGCIGQGCAFTFIQEEPTTNWRYLLAHSPREFLSGATYIPDVETNGKQRYPPPLDDPQSTDPFNGQVELPRLAVTSYGIELRVPIYAADGITIAVILCKRNQRHVGLFLTRDIQGKDRTRPRYFTGCSFTNLPDTRSANRVARLADLGDDIHNLTFSGKKVKASWRTIYVVPTASDLDTRNSTTPVLTINCDPASPFRVPRWLITRFTALQFIVNQKNTEPPFQTLRFFLAGVVKIYVFFGLCTQCRDSSPDKTPQLWVKVDVLLSHTGTYIPTHRCSEDHINSKSWETYSKFFGDADRGVQLSLIPSTRMSDSPESFAIHLELLGHVLGEMFKGPGGVSMFPSLADLKKETPQPAPNDPDASTPSHTSSSQTKATSYRTASSASTATRSRLLESSSIYSLASSPTRRLTASPSHSSTSAFSSESSPTRPSRIPRPVSRSPPDTCARGSPQGSDGGRYQPEQSRELRTQGELARRFQTPSPLPPAGSGQQTRTPAERQRPSGPGEHSQTRGVGSSRLGARGT